MFAIDLRLPHGAWLLFAILGLLLSTPANPGPISEIDFDAQSAEEIALLEELADWLEPSHDLRLADAVHERRESFELFRSYHGDDLPSARVVTLPFGSAIREAAEAYSFDALLIASIIEVESGFDPRAVSRRGATGLMQVMPSTAGPAVDLTDPERNIELGARYLNRLLERFDGDLTLALAAYNAGPGNVSRYGGVPPFRETRHYVDKVLSVYVGHHRGIWGDEETAEISAAL